MDISTVGGIGLAFILIIVGILIGGGSIGSFIDMPSIMIVIGGTIAATFASYPIPKVMSVIQMFSKAAANTSPDLNKSIDSLIELANKARKEGLLSLEEASSQIEDPFIKKGIMLVVDGTDPELVRNLLETELSYIEERHKSGQGMFEYMGSVCPAFGMVGTLIGLVIMLGNMSDPTSIGPSMAVALITTFYGSVMANVVFIPMATKLKVKSREETLEKEVIVEGLLSIQAGENPRIIEEKLKAFLPPSMRKSAEAGGEK